MHSQLSLHAGYHKQASLGFGDTQVDLGCHICLLYRSQEERNQVVIPFLKQGIEDGAACSLVLEEPLANRIQNALFNSGISVETIATSGQLTVARPEDFYFPQGRFLVEETLTRMLSLGKKTFGKGFPSLRGTSDLSFLLNDVQGAGDFLAYEAKLSQSLAKYPVVILCQYDVTRFRGDMVLGVLETHPYVIINGVLIRNPYYIAPEEWLRSFYSRACSGLVRFQPGEAL